MSEVHADWARYEHPDFTITSDLAPAAIEEIVTALGAMKATVTDLPGLDNPLETERYPPMQFLILAKRRDFLKLVERPVFMAFTQSGLEETLLVVGPRREGMSIQHNALHEYTHYLLRAQAMNYPPWYEEGLATLLGHTEFTPTPDGLTVETRLPRGLTEGSIRVKRLMDVRYYVDLPSRRLQTFYTGSAELVNFLLFGNLAGYPDYRPLLEDYLTSRNVAAWEHEALNLDTLTQQARAHARRRGAVSRVISLNLERPSITRVPLAETEALRIMARGAESTNPKEALKIYESLITTFPEDLELKNGKIRSLIEIDVDQAEGALAALSESSGENSGRYVNEAAILTRQCTLRADPDCRDKWRRASTLLRQALRLDPQRIDAVLLLGVAELYAGRPGRAANYLQAALNRVPWSPIANFYYGECQRLLGTTRARPHLEKARDWALREYIRDLATASLDALDADLDSEEAG